MCQVSKMCLRGMEGLLKYILSCIMGNVGSIDFFFFFKLGTKSQDIFAIVALIFYLSFKNMSM